MRAKSTTARDLTTAEAAEISGYVPEVIRRWIREGRLPARRVPGRARGEYRINRDDLEAMIAGYEYDPLTAQIRRVLAEHSDELPEPTDEQIRLIARLLPRPKAEDDVA